MTDEADAQEEAGSGAAPERRRGPRRLVAWALALLLLPPLLYLGFAYAFLNTSLGEKLLNRPGGRVTTSWQGGRSLLPGTAQVRGFTLDGTTRKGTWRLHLEEGELHYELAPLLSRTFRASSVRARGAVFEWHSFEEERDLPPRRRREGEGWKLEFPEAVVEEILSLSYDDTEIDASKRPGSARLHLEIRIRGPFEAPSLEMAIDGATLSHEGETLGLVDRLHVEGELAPFVPRENRGKKALRFASGRIELISEAWDLSSLSYFFRGAPVSLGGRGDLDAEIVLEDGVVRPESTVKVEDGAVELAYLDYRMSGDGGLELGAGEKPEQSRLEVKLETFELGRQDAAPHIRGEDLRLVGTSPPVDLADPRPRVLAVLTLGDARVPDFATFDGLLPEGSPLHLRGGSGDLDLELRLDAEKSDVSGRVELRGKGVEASYHGTRIEGDLRLGATLEEGEIETRRYQLSDVHLDLEGVRTEGVEGWWARLELPRGEVVVASPLVLEADVTAVLRDPRPLVTLMLDSRRPVEWLTRLLDAKRVYASARLELDRRALLVEGLEVKSGRSLTGEGDLRLGDGATTGLLLLELGPLSAAAELLPGGEKDFHLKGSRKWFEKRRREWTEASGEGSKSP